VAGLVQGIQAGAGAVIAAVSGLASSALGAFKGALGIHSPSKVMLEHGEDNIAGATATGVDKGAPKVQDAMARLGDGEKGTGSGKGRGKGKSDGSGKTVTLVIRIADRIREEIRLNLEELESEELTLEVTA
jgi:hypothetical protein